MKLLFQHLSILAELVLIISIILVFFRGQLRLPTPWRVLLLCGVFLMITAAYFPIKALLGGGFYFRSFYSTYSLVLITLFLSWFFRENFFITLFMVFAARNYLDGVNHISDMVGILSSSTSSLQTIAPICFFSQISIYIVSVPILFSFFKSYIHPAITSTRNTKIWNYLWILPLSFYFIYKIVVSPAYYGMGPNWNINMILFPIIWLIAMFFCQLSIFKLLGETSQNILLREKLHTSELLSEMEKKQYSMLQEYIEETRKVRHNLRHHMIAMQGYLERGDFDGSKQYIKQYLSQMDRFQLKRYSGNHAVDSIISYYEQLACSAAIPITLRIVLPEVLPITEIDFCTILGNLLSNAVEACSRQEETADRFIQVHLGITGKSMVAISISNSYSYQIKEENGMFLSSHHAGEGIGIMSVRHIADQYHSITTFHYGNGVFEASLLLNPGPPDYTEEKSPI